MENNAPLKPPEYKRNELGQFDRPGKTMSNAQKPNKKMGEIAEVEIKRSPGRPKGSANKVTVALKEAILQAGENVGGREGACGLFRKARCREQFSLRWAISEDFAASARRICRFSRWRPHRNSFPPHHRPPWGQAGDRGRDAEGAA